MLFLLLPEKSAFFIPALPFFFLLIHYYLSGKKSYALWGCMFLMSPFLSSVQLIDKDRGSLSSGLSIDKVVLNQDVSFDFIYGPIISDYTKRLKKDEFVVKFIDKYQKVNEKSVILCGFWTNHIVLKMRQKEINNPQVIVVPGMSENDMIHYRSCSYRIYYLREQEQYNMIKYHVSPLLYGDLFIK